MSQVTAPIKCPICNAMFFSVDGITNHMDEHKGKAPNTPAEARNRAERANSAPTANPYQKLPEHMKFAKAVLSKSGKSIVLWQGEQGGYITRKQIGELVNETKPYVYVRRIEKQNGN